MTDHLEEARRLVEGAHTAYPREAANHQTMLALGHALIAIAERMPERAPVPQPPAIPAGWEPTAEQWAAAEVVAEAEPVKTNGGEEEIPF